MPSLRPWLSDFYLALAKPTATLLSRSRIQFEEAITRASDTFVLNSHAELSGLRQCWRIITVAGKDVESPQEAVEICPNVRGRIWGRALDPRSKYVKAPDNVRGTLEAWDLTIRRARHATKGGSSSGRRLCPRYILGHRGGGAHPKHSHLLQAPAGGSSSKDPWQISHSPGTQVPKHNL